MRLLPLGAVASSKQNAAVETPLRVVTTQNRGHSSAEGRTRDTCDFRWAVMIAVDTKKIVLSLMNFYTTNSGEQNTANALPFSKLAFEDNFSTSVPVYFGGSSPSTRNKTLASGDNDIHTLEILPSQFGPMTKFTAGEIYWVKGRIELTSTAHVVPYSPRQTPHVSGQQIRWYNRSATTASDVDTYGAFTYSGTATDNRNQGYCPFVLGYPVEDGKSVWVSGDSIGEGIGDNRSGASGWTYGIHGHGCVQYASRDVSGGNLTPMMNFCRSGNDSGDTGAKQRAYIKYARIVFDQYGANDFGGTGTGDGTKLQEVKDKELTFWSNARAATTEDIVIFRPYLIPRLDSNNSYASTAGMYWDNTTGGLISYTKWGPTGIASKDFNEWLDTKVADNTIQVTNYINSFRNSDRSAYVITSGVAGANPMADNTHPSTTGHEIIAIDLRTGIAAAAALLT